jgi:serine/threonine-protein kinase
MSQHIEHASASSSSETIPIERLPRGEQRKVCCPHREAPAGSGSHLTAETQELLRIRLRASSLILLVGFSVFLVRHIIGVATSEPLNPFLLTFHAFNVVVLAVITALLYRYRAIPTRMLRLAELAIFGLPAAFFLALQHRDTMVDTARGYFPPPMAFWPLLIFTYAMFIPNSWRRAARVIGAIVLASEALLIAMPLLSPTVAAVMTVTDFVQHTLLLAITAVGAVFGTHLINVLRREAHEAKQIGQYRLIERLGSGGMGDVYLAEHRMLKRPCAVKLIQPERAGDPKSLARFEREVQMTARLSHWNTVEIYDYGRTDDGTFFYVMEYLPGMSLESLLKRHGPLPPSRVIHLLRQTCQGLREAHSIGLIHRDIKPGNIFVSRRGGLYDVAKLLDFGLVKQTTDAATTQLTHEGAISGTPMYMSPEQARGLDQVDPRSDIYSLGAVAYTMLTGRPPFEGRSAFDVMIAHARDEVTPPSSIQADVPADLEQVILRCLAKDPDQRYQDVDSLDQALADCTAAQGWTQTDAERWWQDNEPASETASIPLRSAALLEEPSLR